MDCEGPTQKERDEMARHRSTMDELRRREEEVKRRQREAADTLKRRNLERAQKKK